MNSRAASGCDWWTTWRCRRTTAAWSGRWNPGPRRSGGRSMAIVPPGAAVSPADSGCGCRDVGHARHVVRGDVQVRRDRSEEHTSELQSLMRISYAVFCLKKKTHTYQQQSNVT